MWGQGGNMRTRWWTSPWRWTRPRWWTTSGRWTTQDLNNWQLCHRADWQTKICSEELPFFSYFLLLLMLLSDGKQFNKYLYFGRSLYCFILTFYNIEAVEDFLGASQTEVKKNHSVSNCIWWPWSITSKLLNGILVGVSICVPYIRLWIAIKRNWR